MDLLSIVENAATHTRISGNFIVIYRNSVKQFTNLIPAFIFYLKIATEASLWDISDKEELLEKKCFKDIDGQN